MIERWNRRWRPHIHDSRECAGARTTSAVGRSDGHAEEPGCRRSSGNHARRSVERKSGWQSAADDGERDRPCAPGRRDRLGVGHTYDGRRNRHRIQRDDRTTGARDEHCIGAASETATGGVRCCDGEVERSCSGGRSCDRTSRAEAFEITEPRNARAPVADRQQGPRRRADSSRWTQRR